MSHCAASIALVTLAYGPPDAEATTTAMRAATNWLAPLNAQIDASHAVAQPDAPHTWPNDQLTTAAWEQACAGQPDALWAFRGGYGAVRHALALLTSNTRPPPLIGYSDITATHACYHLRNWGESIYGPMPGVPASSQAVADLQRAVRGEALHLNQHSLADAMVLSPGTASGPIHGGCLRVCASLCGTPLQPHYGGGVLLLEDIDEHPYQIDRDLTQLELSGALDGIRGIIAGRFPHAQSRPGHLQRIYQLLTERGNRWRVPVIAHLPLGHDHDLLSIILGRTLHIAATSSRWSIDQPGGAFLPEA